MGKVKLRTSSDSKLVKSHLYLLNQARKIY